MAKKLDIADLTGEKEQEYTQYINNDNRENNDEISLMAINELLNKKKLKSISRLKFEQISTMSKLYLYSDTFKDSFTKRLADLILELQISTNGMGRRELVELVSQRNPFEEMTQKRKVSKDIFR